MATDGIFLAAQQGDRAGTDLLLQPTYTIEERPRTTEQRVVHTAVIVVVLFTSGPSAQLTAEKLVPDAVLRQRRFEGAGVEARGVPGVRVRSGVHDDLDLVPFQKAKESLRRVVGVAYGKHRVRRWYLISYRYPFLSHKTLWTVSSIIPRSRSPQTHFRSLGCKIAA